MEMVIQEIKIQCPFCWQKQTILVEPDGGESQLLVSDCEVCCHPMDIHVHWNEDAQKFKARVEKGSGFND